MRIIFFGTPEYVIPILEALHKHYDTPREKQLIAVVTQEPKAVGREKKVTRSAVDNWAYKHKLDIIFDLNDIPGADLGVVAAYGRIIPKFVIDKFSKGILNIHPSLLPKYRGASPIQAALAAGDTTTGVTIIKMDHLMDHGAILSSFKEDISPSDTNESLRKRLFDRSAQFLIDLLPAFLDGKIKPKEQNHKLATYTKLISKQDGFIEPEIIAGAIEGKNLNLTMPISFIKDYKVPANAESVYNLYRATMPWPGIWTYIDLSGIKTRLKILKAHLEDKTLVLDEVQLEGKNPISWEQFREGYTEAKFVA